MLLVAVLCSILVLAAGHGRLINPPGRSTMWRYGFSTPRNSNDHQLSCGGFGVQFYRNDGKCGVCGDPYGGPRDNEAGGKYATGTIAKTYQKGSLIEVQVEITVNHGGWFEFRLCPNNDYRKKVTQGCLDQYVLKQPNGDSRFEMPTGLGVMTVHLQLPAEVTCSQCLLQWKWNTASNMRCDGSNCCRGCGPQEQFYGCSDVTIAPSSGHVVSHGIIDNQTPLTHNTITYNKNNNNNNNIIPGSFIPVNFGGAQIGSLNSGNGASNKCEATVSYKMFHPSADTWCVNSCANNGYCPATRCTEACRVARVVPACTATPFWRSRTPDADTWCKQRCQIGLCPLDYCNKTCLH